MISMTERGYMNGLTRLDWVYWLVQSLGESGVELEDKPGIALSYFLQIKITACRLFSGPGSHFGALP